MVDDVALNKAATIERCVARVREVYANEEKNLLDFTKQDSIILNLQRACEAAIDLAMHIIRKRSLGVPQESRDAFALLEAGGLLDAEMSDRMKRMVGFRNVAVHDYTKLNLEVLRGIVNYHLDEFLKFSQAMINTLR